MRPDQQPHKLLLPLCGEWRRVVWRGWIGGHCERYVSQRRELTEKNAVLGTRKEFGRKIAAADSHCQPRLAYAFNPARSGVALIAALMNSSHVTA